MKPITGAGEKSIRLFKINVDNITMATLMKVLEINIVAQSLSGFSINLSIAFFLPLLFDCSLSLSDEVSENNATSDPETRAEHNRKKNTTIIAVIIPGVIG